MFKKIHDMGNDGINYLKSWFKTFSAGLTISIVAFLFILPFLSQEPAYQELFIGYMILALIFSIFAASWDFLAGIAGQVNFGHGIFLGIGGYACAYFIRFAGYPAWLSIIIGILYTIVIGFLIGILCLRVKGPYLALTTLALSIIFLRIFLSGSFSPIFFGTGGISNLPDVFPNYTLEYLTILVVCIIMIVTLIGLSKSQFGKILKSIRDDETGASASGINTSKYKIMAFVISSAVAGLAGAFFAIYIGAVNPTSNFGTVNSFYPIIMASLGGLGTIVGGAIGAFFFFIVEYVITEILVGRYGLTLVIGGINWLDVTLFFSIILMIVILFAKKGILKPGIEKIKNVYDLIVGK